MRKQRIPFLLILTAAFAAFTLGLAVGRMGAPKAVSVNVPQSILTEPAQLPEEKPAVQTPKIAFPVDINRAGQAELTALPGIGEVLALRILAYREENGPFTAAEDLLNVDGIGQKRMEEIWDLITIGGQ